MKLKMIIILFILTISSCKETIKYEELCDVPFVKDKDYTWFRDMKFGIFIHWGPISQLGLEISWSRKSKDNPEDSNEIFACRTIPSDEYDSLYKTFNPINYNPDEWIELFQKVGAKYFVFVTKHHDGFNMYDTKYSNYKITSENCTFKRDIFRELVDAARKTDLKIGAYYSKTDWYNPYMGSVNHSSFVDYVHNQVQEICTNYGKLDILFFDGGQSEYYIDAYGLYNKIRNWQPNVLINERLSYGGEYINPEANFFHFSRNQLWEENIPIGCSWSWRPNDITKRTTNDVIRELIRVVSQDGNYLLGIGPMPDGKISERDRDKLLKIGQWLNTYGETIYGTRGGPYIPVNNNIFSTCKGKDFFINVFNWYSKDSIVLKRFPANIKNIKLFSTGESLEFTNTTNGLVIKVPLKYQNEISTVIKVETDATVFNIKPIE